MKVYVLVLVPEISVHVALAALLFDFYHWWFRTFSVAVEFAVTDRKILAFFVRICSVVDWVKIVIIEAVCVVKLPEVELIGANNAPLIKPLIEGRNILLQQI